MSDYCPKITTIKKIKFNGKWAEIWEDGDDLTKQWTHTCKGYMIDQMVDAADIHDHIATNGYKGMKIVWYFLKPNWEPFCFAAGIEMKEDK